MNKWSKPDIFVYNKDMNDKHSFDDCIKITFVSKLRWFKSVIINWSRQNRIVRSISTKKNNGLSFGWDNLYQFTNHHSFLTSLVTYPLCRWTRSIQSLFQDKQNLKQKISLLF